MDEHDHLELAFFDEGLNCRLGSRGGHGQRRRRWRCRAIAIFPATHAVPTSKGGPRIRLRRNPVLISAIMSAVIETDRWDNYWLSKQRALNKIDAAVALCMAVGASMMSDHCPPASPWDDPAFTLAAL